MIFLIVKQFQRWLEEHQLGFLRVFTFPEFQATASILISFAICIAFGPWIIGWLRRQKIGDLAQFDQVDVDKLMKDKKGTPTMGGLLIIASIAITTLLLADLRNFYVGMALVCLLWLGAVGAADDWLKLTAARRAGNRQGLTSLEKFLFQVGLAAVLCYFTYQYGREIPERTTFYFPLLKEAKFQLGLGAFVLIGILVMTGSSNAVNLTDGLDGLAAGCMAIVSFAFVVLSLVIGTPELSRALLFDFIKASSQMAVISGAMTGACLGFLWFNCNPARVFMGDTGSLALGGLIGYVAIVIRQELVLFLVGGVFVAETISVILQVSYFKYTRKRFGEGRRLFLMTPIHHHFQRKGWTETQVVVRFWLIGAMLAAMALATVKLR